jgi:SAM-dependent methyltransferase
MALRERIVAQFGRPTGHLGRLAGWIMASRPSNRRRNQWTVELLELRPGERVLELGCGPGLGLAACLARVGEGPVVGLDHAPEMIRQAAHRNAAAVRAGRLRLVTGGLDALPRFGAPYDAALAVNLAPFVADPVALLAALRAVLRPGGRCALTWQPRHPGATAADARRRAQGLGVALEAAGFAAPRVEELALRPVPAVCVLATGGSAGD